MFNYYSVAKNKTTCAKIFLTSGLQRKITVNGKSINLYFYNNVILHQLITYPLFILNCFLNKKIMLDIFVKGGGKVSQVKAINKAILKIIIVINPKLKLNLINYYKNLSTLKIKERKKFGFKKSRKKSQYSKR